MSGKKTNAIVKPNGSIPCDTIRRITKEKIVVRGNSTIRTIDTTTSFLPAIDG